MKKETLEEAAEREFPLLDTEWCATGDSIQENLQLLGHRKSFIAGAKWQAKTMYSEEEVTKLLISCKDRFGGSFLHDYTDDNEVKRWFEYYKKK